MGHVAPHVLHGSFRIPNKQLTVNSTMLHARHTELRTAAHAQPHAWWCWRWDCVDGSSLKPI